MSTSITVSILFIMHNLNVFILMFRFHMSFHLRYLLHSNNLHTHIPHNEQHKWPKMRNLYLYFHVISDLCKIKGSMNYRLHTNHYICYIKSNNEDCVKIPPMTIDSLNMIINTSMKLGKAADIYHLTTVHLRYCGPVAMLALLNLLNSTLDEIYYLSCHLQGQEQAPQHL